MQAPTEFKHEPDIPLARTPGNVLLSVSSGLINGTMIFCFSVAFGVLIFGASPALDERTGMGINLNLATAFISCALAWLLSNTPVAIPSPDITPVLLIVEMVETIESEMGGSECLEECKDDILATVLGSIILSTASVALLFYVMGRFRFGRFVQFVPAIIVHGFFGAIGYKVSVRTLPLQRYRVFGSPTHHSPNSVFRCLKPHWKLRWEKSTKSLPQNPYFGSF